MMGETLLVGTALHAEMKDGLLLPDNDYSTKKLVEHLKGSSSFYPLDFTSPSRIVAAVKANQVFLPVLENSSKARKLRTTVGIFERSKFFFNLPGSIIESIEAVSVFKWLTSM
jgi:exocyst complex component 2